MFAKTFKKSNEALWPSRQLRRRSHNDWQMTGPPSQNLAGKQRHRTLEIRSPEKHMHSSAAPESPRTAVHDTVGLVRCRPGWTKRSAFVVGFHVAGYQAALYLGPLRRLNAFVAVFISFVGAYRWLAQAPTALVERAPMQVTHPIGSAECKQKCALQKLF